MFEIIYVIVFHNLIYTSNRLPAFHKPLVNGMCLLYVYVPKYYDLEIITYYSKMSFVI